MPRHTESAGPSNPTNSDLPFRQRDQGPPSPSPHRNIEASIENAVSTGRTICETLTDTLRDGNFANDEENNLRPILKLAEELHNYQSPVEFTIGVVGDAGVGKSSLINSILNVQRLAKSGVDGTSCTSAATEYRKKRMSDPDSYNVEIECMNDGEIEGLLRQCVVDYRQHHLPDLDSPLASSEAEALEKKAKIAWDTLTAVFGNTPGCTEERFRDQAISTDYIQREVHAWKNGIRWPAGFNAPGVLIHSAIPKDCVTRIDTFLSGRIWPFVKVVRIYLDAEILNSGLVLVDLPGFHDINSACVSIAETRLYQCDNIFVVTDINRTSTNQGVRGLLIGQLGAKLNSLRQSQGVAIVCIKSEVARSQEHEILRDIPNTAEFNPQVTAHLWDKITDAEDDGRPTMHLEARRTNLFISARNQHVRRLLKSSYETRTQTRNIEVFCVSNNLYSEAQAEGRELEARRRRSGWRTSANERNQAIQAKLDGSGIIELQEFCQDIPLRSQIAETRHFLNTRVLDLLQKVELWCNARDTSEDRRQAPVERLLELQTNLENDFKASLATSDEALHDAKVNMLRQPFTQGVFIQTLSSLLEQLKIDRDQAQREFDSQFSGPAESKDSNSQLGDSIRATIQSHANPKHGLYHIRCQASWQILGFCRQQLDGQYERLRQVITLTGTPTHAQAASCEDFAQTMWPSQGLKLLGAMVSLLENESCDITLSSNHRVNLRLITDSVTNNTKDNTELAEIVVTGSLDEVVTTMEQLAWFAAVFRPPITEGLTISSATFDTLEFVEFTSQQSEAGFKLCVDSLEVENLESHLKVNDSSTCWRELFRGGVLAYGFSIAQRNEGSGLEISFELMAFLAQVRVSMEYNGGMILVGHSSCIFPTKKLQTGVQWHFTNATDSDLLNGILMSYPEWPREKDLSMLTSLRTYLGSYPSARVLLGTEKLLQENPVAKSDLPNATSRIELARDGTTSAGFSIKGVLNGTIGGRWAVPKGLRVDLTEHRGYDDRLDKASIRPILLYDCLSKSAWLVSELSLVLHMVLTYLSQSKIQQRRRLRTGCELEAWPQMPFVEACADGGTVARKTISDNHDLYLYTDENGEKKVFWNVVDDFLKDIASIRSAANLKKASSGWQFSASRLQGWDFNDLAVKEESVHQRETTPDSKRVSWWRLSDAKGMLVIFGSNFGQLISPDLTQTKVYPGWECVPTQAELLTASMPCVLELAEQSGVKTDQGDYLLSPEIAWHKPTGRDRSCNQYCNKSCFCCIQELRLVGTARNLVSRSLVNASINRPRNLDSYQAVIFGEPKYYHQSLQTFYYQQSTTHPG